MTLLAIQSIGAFTPVGRNWGQTMGSLRTSLSFAAETPFFTPDGEPLIASSADLALPDPSFRGALEVYRFLVMGAFALAECAQGHSQEPTPLLLCCPEPEQLRADWQELVRHLAEHALVTLDHRLSAIFPTGRAAIAQALSHADFLLQSGRARACYVGGIDSLLLLQRLEMLIDQDRVRYAGNGQGFIPGEAAAFLRVVARPDRETLACVVGVGLSQESATRTMDQPNNGVGLARAMREALSQAGANMKDVGFFAHDASGERFSFKEFALALVRLRPIHLDRWTAALSVGEVGAAVGPLTVAYLAGMHAGRGATAPYCLYAASSDGPTRGAILVGAPPVHGGGHG